VRVRQLPPGRPPAAPRLGTERDGSSRTGSASPGGGSGSADPPGREFGLQTFLPNTQDSVWHVAAYQVFVNRLAKALRFTNTLRF